MFFIYKQIIIIARQKYLYIPYRCYIVSLS